MHIMSTKFAKTLVWKHEYNIELWRHKQRKPNTNDHHMPLIEPPWKFSAYATDHNYGATSGSHACRDCVWPIILDAELYTTCPGERMLVTIRFNVTFLPLRPCYEKMRTCFSKDAESLTTYGCVLWCSQIFFIRPYSLSTTIAFYFVNECSNIAVSVRLMAFHVTWHSHFTWTRPD